MYSVSDIAKLLDVNGKTVKDWSYHFSEYLSSTANPTKGEQRFYTVEDIRIFAYASLYWEEEPDIECIKMGLNSQEYYDIDLINNFITEITPVFQEPTEEIVGMESNILFTGMASLDNLLSLANEFKESGDILFKAIKKQGNLYDFTNPILYQYRHAIELYLKSILRKPIRTHKLQVLYPKFENLIRVEFQTVVPSWLKEMINGFAQIDPQGDILRYGEGIAYDEILVNLEQLKIKMDWFSKSMNRIHGHLKNGY
ncbi:MAG TPA: hypothetical protein DCS09_00850 [Porphyromonadaceae bacterium]|nr:hypothetical protein [Porphyromonadaceae bacterium]